MGRVVALLMAGFVAVVLGAGAWRVAQTHADIIPPPPMAPPPEPPIAFTIVLAGDTGLNASFAPVQASFGMKSGERVDWDTATSAIAPDIDGDINFANLETTVTDRNDLTAQPKLFGFRTHPAGVQALIRTGFNVFSTANNHSMDFGVEGARETLRNLDLMLGNGLLAQAGLGATREEAGRPKLLLVKRARVAISAIGILSAGVAAGDEDDDRPGQLAYQSDRDFGEITRRLSEAAADFRILSVHHGQEFDVMTGGESKRRLRDQALIANSVDLVVGHHQHVVAGAAQTNGRVVLYGLGNFLHFGTQDMSRYDICHDWGMLARVRVAQNAPGEPLTIRSIDAIPLTGTHRRAKRLSPDEAAKRIAVLNYLSAMLDDPAHDTAGLRFALKPDGSGRYCAPGSEELCRDTRAAAPNEDLRAEVETACSRRLTRPQPSEEAVTADVAIPPL